MKKNNRKILVIIGIFIVIGLIGFMVLNNDSSNINIVGSTSVQPTAEKLVEAYEKTHPDSKINVQGGGSSVGIKSAKEGSADIGTSSKDLDDKDKEGLIIYELGNDGIVIAVNNKNGVSDLSNDQLKKIFSGEITNWNQVGGSDGEINIITREEGSGTLDAFKSIVMDDNDIKGDAIVQSSTEAVKQSVSQDPNAIGFVSFAHMSDDVKAVSVNNIEPSEENLADGSYELQRPFLFLTKGEPTGEVKEFINWVLSEEGSKVLQEEKIIKSSK
ncbi:phosphate ABC transporter substrate-binding protein [Methanobrevibacter sp. DSM 116169]|uniref:phosphate ABC transporter substrate-binding protein n=1 Tax=Methanobrevibacter sp. DSM 116169 TaxID=3242727 RepID=UPI0038FCFC4A